MAETSTIKVEKLKVAGKLVYPATILDAVKDATAKIKNANNEEIDNPSYGKTIREIITDNEKVTALALTELDGRIGDLDDLTVEAVSIVAAINALSGTSLTAEQVAQIGTNAAAIATLNGSATEDGSVAKAVADAIAAVVANAPEDFDTLKEIADWIANDDNKDAAEIIAGITANTEAIGTKAQAAEYYTTYEEYVAAAEAEGWAPEYTLKREFDDDAPDAGEKVKSEAKAATGLYKEIADAKAEAIAAAAAALHAKTTVVEGTANGTVAVDGVDVAVKGLGSAAYTDADAYDEAGAAAAVQGSTTSTVKSLEDVIGVASKTAVGTEGEEGYEAAVTATGLQARIESLENASVEIVDTTDTTEYADVF